jgi:hypothetical protein
MKVIAGNPPSFRPGGIGKHAMNQMNLQAMLEAKEAQVQALLIQLRHERTEHLRIVKTLNQKLRRGT